MKRNVFIIEKNKRGRIAKSYKHPYKDYIKYNQIIDALIMFGKG